jgi:hypothetical protein
MTEVTSARSLGFDAHFLERRRDAATRPCSSEARSGDVDRPEVGRLHAERVLHFRTKHDLQCLFLPVRHRPNHRVGPNRGKSWSDRRSSRLQKRSRARAREVERAHDPSARETAQIESCQDLRRRVRAERQRGDRRQLRRTRQRPTGRWAALPVHASCVPASAFIQLASSSLRQC